MRNGKHRAIRWTAGARVLALGAAILAATSSRPASALESGAFAMEILVDGRPLAEYAGRGTTYVEAVKGHEFEIRLRNRSSDRIGVALSVDGLNSIDARTTTALEARKWILGPYETMTLSGWQTGSSTARRFFFTTESRSYGSWLGKTANLGVVAAAVFRERVPSPPRWSKNSPPPPRRPILQGEPEEVLAEAPVPREMPEQAAGNAAGDAAPAPSRAKEPARHSISDELAATGIGRETRHPVVEVEFDSESTPCAELQIRYEYREALARLGVLPAPRPADDLARRERARGFAEPGFAPDPYR